MANMDERKAQLVFEAEDNTKAGTDSVKAGLQGIADTAVDASGKAAAALDSVAKAGVETGQQLDRSTASISTSIKRVISDTQRQIATLKAEASGGGTVDIFENLISQRGANAEALKPLIGNLRTLRTELDGLRQAEQRSAVDVNYERERAAAEIARRRADATAALTQVIEQQEAAERRLAGQNAFVQSLKAQSDAIGKTKADLLELQAAQLGVSSQAAPYIAKLREQEQALTQNSKVLNAYGQTAKQTTAALRQVPAQITDIFVSLQGGQAPLTVLLQQGGQLKDVFGGVVPALKGLASGVIGLVNPYTLAAAAAAALAVAYYQGSQEADAYNRAIVLTGNAAGVTAAQLKTTAAAISQTVGTQGAAAEVLAQLAQTGQVAGASMQRFGEVTLKVQRDLGIAAKDTVKDFAALGESPVEASLKLTKQYGYLTAATLEQIKALQDQGKAQEAATLAQNTYATAMDTKADRLRAQLGTIERAWRAITSAAKGGWDAILNVGRAETSADRLAELQRQLEQRMNTPLAVDNPAMRASREKAIAYLKEQIGLLQSDERAQRRGAEAEAERQRVQEAGAKAFDAVTKAQEKGLGKQEQLNKALKEYRDRLEDLRKSNPDSAALLPAAVARGEKAIREQFAEKGGGDRGAEGRRAELADLDAKIKAEKDYTQQLRERGIQAEKNNAGTRLSDSIQQQLNGTLSATTRAFLEQKLERAKLLESATREKDEEEKRQKAIAKSEEALRKQIQAVYDESSAVEQQRQKLDETTAAYGKSALAVAKLTAERIKLRLAEAEGSDRFDPAYVENLRRLLAEQQKLVSSVGVAEYEKVSRATQEQTLQAQEQNDLLQLEISLIGRSEVERRKIVAAREQELKLAKELRDIEKLGLDDDQTERLKAEKREEYRQKAVNAGNKAVLDDWNKTSDMISTSLTDALLRGFESGKGFAQNLRDAVANMFKTLVLRPVVSAVVNPIAGAVSGVVNSALYGGASALAGGANVLSGIQGTTGILGSLGTFLGTNTVATNAALAGTIGIDSASALAAAQGASAAGGGGLAGLLSNPVTIGLGAVLALSALSKSFKGETRTGGQFGVAFDGSVTNQRRGQAYTMVGQQFDRDFTGGASVALTNGQAYRLEGDPVAQESAIRNAVAGTAKTINTLLEKYGSEAALTGFSAGLETSGKGRGGVFAGGLLSTGAAFGESGKGDNYAGTLYEAFSTNSPDFKTALENFTVDLQQATLQALQAATDLPAYVSRVIKDVKVEELGAEEVAKLLEAIADLPNVLLKAAGTSRDALVQQFTEGLAKGDAAKAGQDVADTLVASIEAALYANATGKIFDVVNNGIIAPVIDAITTGASVSEALSEATVQKTIERAKAQASALSELFGNAEFTAALESIRTSVGDALGQAGGAFGYTPKFQIEATKELDDAAKAAADAAEAARKKWQDITDALLDDRAQLNIDLLRAQGQEEAALAAERLRAIEGYDAYRVALYDGNQALREQITELGKLNTLRDEEKALNIEMLQARGDFAGAMALITEGMSEAQRAAYLYNDSLRKQIDVVRSISSELPGAIAKFLSPDQRLAAGYTGIASDLSKVGINVGADALAAASLDQIAAAAMAVYNLGTTSDETRLALVRAVSGLADLKTEAESAAEAARRAAAQQRAGLETRLLQLQGNTVELRNREVAALEPANRALQRQIYALEDLAAAQGRLDAASNAIANEYLSAQSALESAQQGVAEATRQAAQEMLNFGNSIVEFLNRLQTTDMGNTSPESRYQAAAEQFRSTAALAQSGDRDALARITGVATDYLGASKAYYASGSGFSMDEGAVKSALQQILGVTGSGTAASAGVDQMTGAQEELVKAMERMTEIQEIVRITGVTTSAATTDLLAAFMAAQDDVAKATADEAIWRAADKAAWETRDTLQQVMTDASLITSAQTQDSGVTLDYINTSTATIQAAAQTQTTILTAMATSSAATRESSEKTAQTTEAVLNTLNAVLNTLNAVLVENSNMTSQLAALRQKVAEMESSQRLAASAPAKVKV